MNCTIFHVLLGIDDQMNIRDLKYFIAVAKYKNFGQAAFECAVSQPALSMQLKKLEEELGLKLFERNNKHVMLTQYGTLLEDKAKKIIFLIDEFKNAAKFHQNPNSGEFRLGAFPTLAPYYFPQIVPKITKNFPKLQLFLFEEKTEILVKKLKNGKLDAIMIALPVEDSELTYQSLFKEEFLLAVNKQHALASQNKVTLEILSDEKLLLLDEGHCLRDQVLDLCAKIGAKEYSGFRATSLETLRQMVVANVGVTLIPKIAINNNDKAIKYIKFEGIKPLREIALVWRKTYHLAELLNSMVSIL